MWTEDEMIVLPIMLISIIIISALLGYLLRNKSEKIRGIPLIVIASVILVLEVIKQIRAGVTGEYTTWTIPLHFCSFFMVWFPLAQFTTGKVKQVGMACSLATSAMMFLLFYINPSSIINDSSGAVFESFSNFHTFTFHHLIILYLFCMLALRVYKPQKSDFLWGSIAFTLWAIIATTMAHVLDTNYTNILHSNIPFMESLRVATGQIFYTIVMYIFGIGAFNLVLLVYRLIYNAILKKKQQKK